MRLRRGGRNAPLSFSERITALHKEKQMSHDGHRVGILTGILGILSAPEIRKREKTCRKSLKKNGAGGRRLTRFVSRGNRPLRALPRVMGGTFPPFPLVRFHPPENKKDRQNNRSFFGAGGRNRTDMELPPEDFESSASTSSTTPARGKITLTPFRCQEKTRHNSFFVRCI